MRFRNLTIDRFGHFTDQSFDFGAAKDRPDFHIIYGPNEAGKTTTMEAALRLFYGFPHRDGYAFKHQRNNLKVSGLLEIEGQQRRFLRLPKRSGSLVDEAGIALPETALAAHLAGLSEEDYRKLLCLDDDTIERGGEEIAQARGDIGRLLFSAAAGVADLSTVLENVREEADTIWRKRATKTRVAELKRDLMQVEKGIRALDVSANAWRGLKKALADAKVAEEEVRTARNSLHSAAAKVTAKHRAVPLIAEFDELAEKVAPFAAYPDRLEFDPEDLVGMVAEVSQVNADILRLTEEIETKTSARQGIARAPQLLALPDKLETLEELRARHMTAELDLERRRGQMRDAEAAMAHAARDLEVSQDTDPRHLVLSPAQIAGLESAREELHRAIGRRKVELEEIADLTERRDRAQATVESAELNTPDQQGVSDILAGHSADRLAPAFAKAQQAIDALQADEHLALHNLAAGDVVFCELPNCPTSVIKAQEWANNHAELTQKIGNAKHSLTQHLEDVAARRAQADHVASSGLVVSDAQASALKAERDNLWLEHKARLVSETAKPFENAMQTLDTALFSRVEHARDLGQLRQIEQAQAEAQARADQVKNQLDALSGEKAALEEKVNEAAAAVGLHLPQLPLEWLDWVQRHGVAAEASRKLAQARETYRPEIERAKRLFEALQPHLRLESPDFDSVLAAARASSEAEREEKITISKACDALNGLQDDLTRREKKLETAQDNVDQAEKAWCGMVTDTLGNAVSENTLRASIEPLRILREQETERSKAAQRVAMMEADQENFAHQVEAIARANELPLADTAIATFADLSVRSAAAQSAEHQSEELATQIKAAEESLAENNRWMEETAGKIKALGQIFPEGTPVATLDELRVATVKAEQVIVDRIKMAKLERAICSELGVGALVAARTMLDGATLTALEAEAETIKSDLAETEKALTKATEERVTAKQALAQVTGSTEIALLTERKATLELELEEAALKYLELSLGYNLADEALRRYRDNHRSGMMTATERCFATLTQGAYARLATQPEGSAEVLLAVDREGAFKRVSEMSKGTRFQLYLALRAAAHEQLVAQGTCLPFFCDDIFETFDEERTSAACRVMEQIGRSGQAIYLTHHRHVVEIARQVCDTAPLVHEI